jgi:hypothetical protein
MVETGILPRDVADQLDAHLARFHSRTKGPHAQ